MEVHLHQYTFSHFHDIVDNADDNNEIVIIINIIIMVLIQISVQPM